MQHQEEPKPFDGIEEILEKVLNYYQQQDAPGFILTKQQCHDLLAQDPPFTSLEEEETAAAATDPTPSFLLYYITLSGVYTPPTRESWETAPIFSNEERTSKITAMPLKPYYLELVKVLKFWAAAKVQPIKLAPMHKLVEVVDDTIRLDSYTPQILDFAKAWESCPPEQRAEILVQILVLLGIRGILTLIHVRKTEGSIDALPPSCVEILRSFNKKCGRGTLSEGARALSKHYHRSSEGWWGNNKGTDASKNKDADMIMRNILRGAVWLNLHMLPHNVPVFEIRNHLGYGARWSSDGKHFRGFLEPQMEDGHERGWRH